MGVKRQRTLSSDTHEVRLQDRERHGGQRPNGSLLHTKATADRGEQLSTPGAHSARQSLQGETDANEPHESDDLSLSQLEAGRPHEHSSNSSGGLAKDAMDTAASDPWTDTCANDGLGHGDGSDGESSDEEEMRANDCLCAWCDDGGKLLLCDGSCMRTFHVQPGECNILDMPSDLISKVMSDVDSFLCPNCLSKEHQCFFCKQHGCFDRDWLDKQEVFRCTVASCGKYYHPACVKQERAALLSGSAYICPLHECARLSCQLPTWRLGTDTELVPCRRCPTAYHHMCLPNRLKIAHARGPLRYWIAARDEEGNLLVDQTEVEASLLYCMKHAIRAHCNQPDHLDRDKQPYSLFTATAHNAWRLHYAEKYPHLKSSAQILRAKETEIQRPPRNMNPFPFLGTTKNSSCHRTPVAAACWLKHYMSRCHQALGEVSEDDNVLLARRRHRLMKQLTTPQQPKTSATANYLTHEAAHQSATAAASLNGQEPQPRGPPSLAAESPTASPKLAQRTSDGQFAQASQPAAVSTQLASSPSTTSDQDGDGSTAHEPGPNHLAVERPVAPHFAVAPPSRARQTPRPHPQAGRPPAASIPAQRAPRNASKVHSHSALSGSEREDDQPLVQRPRQARGTTSSPSQPSHSGPAAAEPPASGRTATPVGNWNPLAETLGADSAAMSPAAPTSVAAHAQAAVAAGAEVPPRKRHKANALIETAIWTTAAVDEYEFPDYHPASPRHASPATSSGEDSPSALLAFASGAAGPPPADSLRKSPAAASPTAICPKSSPGDSAASGLLPSAPSPTANALEAASAAADHEAASSTDATANMTDTAAASDPGTALQLALDHPSSSKAATTLAATEAARAEAPILVEAPAAVQSAATPADAVAAAPAAVSAPPVEPVAMSTEAAAALAASQHDGDEDDEPLSPQQVELRVLDDIHAAHGTITLDALEAGIRRIKGYEKVQRKTIAADQLETFRCAVQAAAGTPERSRRELLLGAKILRQMHRSEDDFRVWLAPFLHGKRYSSYGRHFSRTALLKEIANILEHFMRPNDVVVDFSCGANEFVPIVKRWAAAQGLKVFGRAYDIFTAANLEDFERKNWFDCQKGELPHGDRLVIGLNPPFGKGSQLANGFVQHAASFRPRVIVLIAPPSTITPKGYRIAIENQTLTADRAFYVPGAQEDSWNKVAPPLRIMIREDCFEQRWGDEAAYAVLDAIHSEQPYPSHEMDEPLPPHLLAHGLPLPPHLLAQGVLQPPHQAGIGDLWSGPPQQISMLQHMAHAGMGGAGGQFLGPMTSGGFDDDHMPHDPRLPLPPPPVPAPLPPDPYPDHQQFENAGSVPFERLPPPEWHPDGCERCGSPSHGSDACWVGRAEAPPAPPEGLQHTPFFVQTPGDRRPGGFVRVAGGYCDRCGQAGHKGSGCPTPAPDGIVFCRRCGMGGHFARVCPNLPDLRQSQQQQQRQKHQPQKQQPQGTGSRPGSGSSSIHNVTAQPDRRRQQQRSPNAGKGKRSRSRNNSGDSGSHGNSGGDSGGRGSSGGHGSRGGGRRLSRKAGKGRGSRK